jgi:UDP-3-O-[3-hydroxymyristoyl] glucosamine N-acyltransferase
MRKITAGEIAGVVGGEVRGDPSVLVRRVMPLDGAEPDALSFVASARYLSYLQATRAGVVLIPDAWFDSVPDGCTAIVVDDPHVALHGVLTALHPPVRPAAGVHETAAIASTAKIGVGVTIGAFAVVAEGVEIGDGATVGAHAVIGAGSRLGRDAVVHPHVTLYEGVIVGDRAIIHSGARIGKDGFGYVWKDGGHRKVPQIGGCVIGEDVEIGTNVTIDRGSIGDTVVGAGTKIDNLVHLGHNVRLGRHVLLISQVGISGSTSVGDGAVLAGQVGVGGHLSIGQGARIGGQAGVTADVPAGETYSGYPARPHRDALRAQANVFKLPDLFRRLKRLETRVFGHNAE